MLVRLMLIIVTLYGQRIPLVTSSNIHCSHVINEEIQRCVQPVANYAKVLNPTTGNTSSSSSQSSAGFGQALQLPKLGRHVFRELCRLIRDFENCVEDFVEKCPKHITVNLIKASYGFLCNEGYETFMRSAECLMDLDQRPSVKRCHDDTLLSIEKINSEGSLPISSKLERMCGALNFFSGCVKNPIKNNCGSEAWHVIYRVLEDTTKTLMPSCEFTGRNTSPTPHRQRAHASTASTPRESARHLPTTLKASWLLPKGELNRPKQASPTSSMEGIVAVVEEEGRYSPYEIGGEIGERENYAHMTNPRTRNYPNGAWRSPIDILLVTLSLLHVYFFVTCVDFIEW